MVLTPPLEATDGQLLERFVARREEEAFAALLRRHGPMVLDVGRRVLRQTHDAEDVFQATFLLLANKASTIRRRESVASWLYGVAHRLAIKAKQRAERRGVHERRAASRHRTVSDIDAAWQELHEVLDRTLRQLPEPYQVVLLLAYYEGLTQEEIARQIGCPLGTVRSRLARGRALLQSRLVRRGLTLSAAAFVTVLAAQTARAIPAALLQSTLTAAGHVGQGQAAAPFISPHVAELVRGGLQSMLLEQFRRVGLTLVAVVAMAVGAGVVTQQILAARQLPPPMDKLPPPAPADSSKPQPGKAVAVDPLGDPLPSSAVTRLGSPRLRHGQGISCAVFSSDGKTIASVGGDQVIRLWEVPGGKEVRRLTGHEGGVNCLVLSPDGKVLASGGDDKTVRLWSAATGEEFRRWKGSENRVKCLAFSPNGKTLATGSSVIALWDPETGLLQGYLGGHGNEVRSVAFSADGQTLVSASWDKTVRLWDVASGKEVRRYEGHTNEVEAAVLSPDGRLVASAGTQSPELHLWEAATGKEVRRLEGKYGFSSLGFSADGKTLLSGGQDGLVRLWNVADGKELRRFEGHSGGTNSVSFSPDGKIVAAAADRSVLLWETATGKRLSASDGHASMIWAAALSSDGRIAATADYRTIRFWDVTTGRQLRLCEGHPGRGDSIVFAPDGKTLVSNGWDKKARVWDVSTGKEVRQLEGEIAGPCEVAMSVDGKLLASVEHAKGIALWDLGTGKEVRRWPSPKLAKCAAFSPDGKILATGEWEKVIRLWDVATGKELQRLEGQQGSVYSVAFSPDGRTLASVSCKNQFRVSAGEDRMVRLWDVASGKQRREFGGSPGGFYQVAFSPDGRTLVTAGEDGFVRLWETATGRERRFFLGHAGPVAAVAFSRDGRMILSGSSDTTALLWDVTNLRPGGPLHGLRLAAADVKARWTDLAGTDAWAAHNAIWLLADSPALSVPFLAEGLKPIEAVEPRRLEKLIADLDSDQFAVREQATRELEKLAELAEPALRKALTASPSTEAQRRIGTLLQKLDDGALSAEQVRLLRAVEVLEQAATVEARQLLQVLAKGTRDARLIREAEASLERSRRSK